MRRSALLLSMASLATLAPACNLGTLDDFSTDQAAEGSEEQIGQARALWRVYDVTKSDDAAVAAAIKEIDTVVQHSGLPTLVRMDSLTKDDLALVGKGDHDPGLAQGMLLIDEIDCSLADANPLVVAKNQDELYPGVYKGYTRTFDTDVQAYLAGTSPTVQWQTTYFAELGEHKWSANLTGAARYVKGAYNGAPVILARTVLNGPATFSQGGEDSGFDQDYQIELYYEHAPGKVIHFYGLWRDFHLSGLASSSDLYVNTVLGNSEDFDTRTGIICKNHSPPAKFQ